MKETKVVVFGYDELLLASLEFLSRVKANVVTVVFPSSRTDERANAVRSEVAGLGFTILQQPPAGQDDAFCTELELIAPDVILVWSYPMILSERVISIPIHGAVNIHFGLLPQYRGVNGVRRALLNGETETGLTIHYMDAGIDTGPMIARLTFPIGPEDDILLLMQRSRYAGVALLQNTWQQISNGTAARMQQDTSLAHYYSLAMEPRDIIDWSRQNKQIHNLIRASAFPFPGVHTFIDGRKITLRRAKTPSESETSSLPGTVETVTEVGFTVATGSGLLTVTAIEIDSEPVPNRDLNMQGIFPGSRFTSRAGSEGVIT
jgi:methionyl-tRNA formyltransferase